MNRESEIRKELREMNSVLAEHGNTVMPYDVPVHYFEQLPPAICDRVNEEAVIPPVRHKTMPYPAPEGYFEWLPLSVMKRITSVLDAPPEGYFARLPGQILRKVRQEQPISLPAAVAGRTRKRVYAQWAAAAVFIIAMGLGLATMVMQDSAFNAGKQLAFVSSEAVSEYVLQHIDEFTAEELAEAGIIAWNGDHTVGLPQDLDERDIIQYLDETGGTELN